jgi:hypothetical protein
MKKISLLLLSTAAVLGVQAQQPVHDEKDGHNHSTPAQQAVVNTEDNLQMKEMEFDFSKIPQGKPVYHFFEIVNTGNTVIKLDNVQASCGCTTPEWSRDPIAPGATAKIKIGYNAAAEGVFEKFITIMYDNNAHSKQIKIKGQVWKAPEGPAPLNPAADLLKKQTF